MDDTIYRQAAIDELDHAAWGKEYDKVLAKTMLESLPTAQQWIPCSERLPEYDGDAYLVTDYCEQINRKRIHVSYCYINKEGFWSDVPLGYKVIAWMPLPEPYRERRTDEIG